jgi:hypothetical protein
MRKRSHDVQDLNENSKQLGSERIRESQSSLIQSSRSGQWIALALCVMVWWPEYWNSSFETGRIMP